jgi:hypothetical protein
MVAAGLLAAVGCSDDDNGPKPDMYKTPDAGVDSAPPVEAGADMAPEDAGPEATPGEAGVDAAPDAGPKYSGLVGVVEYTGDPGTGSPIRLFRALAAIERPDPQIKPDFIDSPTPPNCYGYKWTATTLPNRSAWDAGKLTIKGHKTVVYVDGDSATPTPAPLPASIECTRKQMPGSTTLWFYDCGLPEKAVLPAGSAFDSSSKLDIAALGGADVPAFSETGVAVAGVPTVKTDLTKLDTRACPEPCWSRC